MTLVRQESAVDPELIETLGNAIVYAIGDMHGMSHCSTNFLRELRSIQQITIARRGDVVNRGPATHDVIEWFIARPRPRGDRWIVLRGNHERSFIDAFRARRILTVSCAKAG